jgi:hypothetical protein
MTCTTASVLLGSIAGMKKVEKQVHMLVYQHCAKLGEPGARHLCIKGEWFDDRILPFVKELALGQWTASYGIAA